MWNWGGYGVSSKPVLNSTLKDVSTIAAVAAESRLSSIVVLKTDGTVWSSGDGRSGQLGRGETVLSGSLGQVPGLTDIKKIWAGYSYYFALKSDGSLWAWGHNGGADKAYPGLLGDGTKTVAFAPKQVATGVMTLSTSGNHTLALKTDGSVLSWGGNSFGQLGDNSKTNRLSPVAVHDVQNQNYLNATNSTGSSGCTTCAPADWVALKTPAVEPRVIAGPEQSYMIRADGTVWAWGRNNKGLLGDGTTIDRKTPVMVKNLSDIVAVEVAGAFFGDIRDINSRQLDSSHAIALKSDGTVWAWGENDAGQLGDDSLINRLAPVQIQGLSDVVAIAASYQSSYALKSDGTVWAWGKNNSGQLGDGSTIDHATPAKVRYLSGVRSLYARPATDVYYSGMYSSYTYLTLAYALKADGTVWSWGENRTHPEVEASLVGIGGIVALAPSVGGQGPRHVLILKNDKTVWSYGNDYSGQLGDGSAISTGDTLRQVTGLTDVTAIWAGNSNSFALKSDGSVWAWGYNGDSATSPLGDGTTDHQFVPKQVIAGGVVSLSAPASSHALALNADGSILAWGKNQYGQLGDNTTNTRRLPQPVHDAQNVNFLNAKAATGSSGCALCAPTGWVSLTTPTVKAAVAEGHDRSYAIRSDGSLWAWGANNAGQLGDGSQVNRTAPVPVSLSNVVAVAAGYQHTLALKSDGTVWSWGKNDKGQLGDGSLSDHLAPALVPDLAGVVAITAAASSSFALKSDGTVWTWGNNESYALGDGSTTSRASPAAVPYLAGVKAIGAVHGGWLLRESYIAYDKYASLYALKNDGTVWSFGYSATGVPELVTPLVGVSGVRALAVAQSHRLLLKDDGTVWAYGNDSQGQLGDSSTASTGDTLRQVKGLTDVAAIAVSGQHVACSYCDDTYGYSSFALKTDGSVWAWGYNGKGQLGDGTTTSQFLPKKVIASGVVALAATDGASHVLALKDDGAVLAWGANTSSQLGDNTTINRTTPMPVHDAQNLNYLNATNATGSSGCAACASSGWVALSTPPSAAGVAVGARQSYLIRSDGSVSAWGDNAAGELGDGTTTSHKLAGAVKNLANVVAVAGSHFEHALALKADGTVWAWGKNTYGEIGDGSLIDRLTPVQVPDLFGVVAIATGSTGSSYALKSDGTVWAWGRNHVGQLGDGTTTDRRSPVGVRYLSGVKSLTVRLGDTVYALKADGSVWSWGGGQKQAEPFAPLAGVTGIEALVTGTSHLLVLKSDKTVWAYGSDGSGQLGDSSAASDSTTPIQVSNMTNVVALAAGDASSYALKADGSVWAWGNNGAGQLGDGTTTNRFLPKQIVASGVASLSASPGVAHVLALKTDGTLLAWGGNANYQLGDNSTLNRGLPIAVHDAQNINYLNAKADAPSSGCAACAPTGWTALTLPPGPPLIAAGSSGSYAVLADGGVWSWGRTTPPGDGKSIEQQAPTKVTGLSDVVAMADAQGVYTLALKADGTVWAWGKNTSGQLGDGTVIDHFAAAQVKDLSGVVAIAVSGASSYALKSDGTVWAWGKNNVGQLGDGSKLDRLTPVQATGASAVVSLIASNNSVYALKSDGTVWTWGSNSAGQLGDGATTDRAIPAAVGYLSGVKSLTARSGTVYALKADGSVWSWGGQVKQPELETPLIGIADIVAMASGSSHMLVLKKDGTVWSYGDDTYGQLGDSSATSSGNSLRQVYGLANVTTIAAAGVNSYAVLADGSVWAWGINNSGQLGDGSLANRPYAAPMVNSRMNGLFDLTPATALDATTLAAAPTFLLEVQETDIMSATIKFDESAKDKVGFVYITGYLPASSPLLATKTGGGVADEEASLKTAMAAPAGFVSVVVTRNGVKQGGLTATTEPVFTGTLNNLSSTYTLYNVSQFDRKSNDGVFCVNYSVNGSAKGLSRTVVTGGTTAAECPELKVAQAVTTTSLTVTRNGAGKVTSSPAGIDCGSTCTTEFANSTVVTLTATPSEGNRFTGWSGGGCSGTASCSVTLIEATAVEASFAPSLLDGACGAAHNAVFAAAPGAGLCAAGTVGAVNGSGPWSWSCSGLNGGATASCSAAIRIDGVCGNAHTTAMKTAPTTGFCNAGSASAVSGAGPWSWTCAGSSGGATASCAAPLKVDGACGSANSTGMSSAPSAGLCASGVAGAITGAGPWSWSCTGGNGGETASCSAPLKSDGVCGSANAVATGTAPTAGLCASGAASAISASNPWTWSCAGSNGGATTSCSAPLKSDGACGSANAVAVSSVPTAGLCASGTAGAMGGSGPWSWSCAGGNGGAAASCSAPLKSLDGACGRAHNVALNSAPSVGLCASGTASSVGGAGPWSWSCAGSSGGSVAQCSASRQASTPDAVKLELQAGWNLLGNGVEAEMNVASALSDTSQVITVWKWVTSGSTEGIAYPAWAFYAPAQTDGGKAYAAGKGYDALTTIKAGEGFWVNVKAPFTLTLPAGEMVKSSSYLTGSGFRALGQGWNLIATGDALTPEGFNRALSGASADGGALPLNVVTLWAWDAAKSGWYFWSPKLVNEGGLAGYLTSKSYLDFSTLPTTPAGTLSPGMGFWVNRP